MKRRHLLYALAIFGLMGCSGKNNSNPQVVYEIQPSRGTTPAVESPTPQTDGSDSPWKTSVTDEMGRTVIKQSSFPFQSSVATATTLPWSSWWYPKIEDDQDTADSLISALTKYDLYRRTQYGPNLGSAAEYEASNGNPTFASWEGLCDAWSLASILAPQPVHAVHLMIGPNLVTFTISDLKALLLKTYEAVPDSELKYYGQRFTGDEKGWDFPDMYPDQFHRFIEVQLFQKHQAFIMDHDPGVEVWNVPVYKANYNMSAVPGDPNSVAVQTWIYSAESTATDQRDFVGTIQGIREYNYILHGTRNSAGDLEVQSGEWVKGADGVDSVSDHPDFITVVPSPVLVTRKSNNPEIDPKVVDEILAKAY